MTCDFRNIPSSPLTVTYLPIPEITIYIIYLKFKIVTEVSTLYNKVILNQCNLTKMKLMNIFQNNI